ncbi:MAG: hypothetical protein OEP95_02295 [Myxococcales bacterium]|nr:hypothetical protein [Myxococcales bacterium]
MSCFRISALSFSAALCLALPTASLAADPAEKCQKATAKALSACIQGVSKAEVGCYKKTDAACAAGDPKRAKALEKLEATLAKDCTDDTLVEAAGYAPLDPAGLTDRLRAACEREVDDISERVFSSFNFQGGVRGEVTVGLSDPKCQLAAGKEVGSGLSKMIKTAGKCVGKTCDAKKLDKAAASLVKLEEKIAKKVDKKCSDPAGLFGLDAAGLAAETSGRVATAAAGPCDPLDTGHCMMPFTNDYFTVTDASSPTGRRLNFSTDGMPRTATGIPVEPTKWDVVDGFSVGPMLVSFEQEVDLGLSATPPITDFAASLEPDATYVLLDAETGEQQLLMVERDLSGPPVEQQALIGRVGRNLENSTRYLVAQRGLVDATGAALPVNPVFAEYRDRTSSGQLPVEARRAHMEALLGELEAHGITRADLHLAWDFTTQSVHSTAQKLLTMRDDAFDNVLGTTAPGFTVDTIDDPYIPGEMLRRIDGTFQVPLYLTQGGVPGSELRLGPDGQPVNEGDFFTARYRCIIPETATTGGAAPAIPARAALYGHGLLGTGNQTSSSHVRAFAFEHNLVICGTDWTGFAEEDEPTVFEVLADFSNFPRFIERQHQGILNFQVLGRLMTHPDGFASDAAFQIEGESMIDPSGLFYDGNSQGGILGGVLAAVSQDIERFVLGVPGINYSTLLNRSVDFTDFGVILNLTYPNGIDRSILLAVAQILWDQTDPSGHVRHTTADTYANTPPKKLLYQVAFGDHQVAPFTAEVAARSNGTAIHTPVLDPGLIVPEVDPYFDIPAIPAYPYDGSAIVIWDSGNPPPPIGSTPPVPIMDGEPGYDELSQCAKDHGSDPHECPRRHIDGREQKSEFLKNDGVVIDACGGMACRDLDLLVP